MGAAGVECAREKVAGVRWGCLLQLEEGGIIAETFYTT